MITIDRDAWAPILDTFPAPAHLLGPCVYRAHSADRLLYVGMSTHIRPRLRIHRNGSPWWPEMTYVELQFHVGRDEALRAELRAIKTERPAYNRYPARRIDEPRSLRAGRGETAALTPTVGRDRQEEEQ